MEAITTHLGWAGDRRLGAVVAQSLAVAATQFATAEITQYTNEAAWRAAAGPVTTIGTPDIPPVSSFDDHFIDSGLILGGVLGTALPEWIAPLWGLPAGTTVFSGGGSFAANFRFTEPISAFAMEWAFTEYELVDLFLGNAYLGSFIWTPQELSVENPPFHAFTSTVAFDRVKVRAMWTPWTPQYGRAVHFTQIVPAPAAGVALMCAMPLASRRRRRVPSWSSRA